MLQNTADLSINLISEATDTAPPVSRLVIQSAVISLPIAGKELIAQYKIPLGYLALLTEDCPFEEALHFYLLDDQGHILDQLELSAAYNTGTFELQWLQNDGLLFSFFNSDESWQLSISQQPKWRLPRLYSPVKSGNWFKRGYLNLQLQQVSD